MTLTANRLSLLYDSRLIFKNLSLKIQEGDILALIGSNGSGKSSLLRVLAGLVDPNADFYGELLYDDQNVYKLSVAERCTKLGIIMQEPETQVIGLSVREELAFACENLCLDVEQIKQRIAEISRKLAIEQLLDCNSSSLSGGEKQLVAIGSILAMQPKVLLADEITSGLDTQKTQIVINAIVQYAQNGNAVVFSSHQKQIQTIATKTFEMIRGKNYADNN